MWATCRWARASRSSVTRRMSRSTRLDSASGGMPRRPSLNDTGPSVHAGALGHARVFGVLDDAEAHARGGGEGLAHHAVFEDGVAVVGDGHGAGGLERGIVVEGLALGAAGSCGDGEDADGRAALRGDCIQRVISGESFTGSGVGHGGDGR